MYRSSSFDSTIKSASAQSSITKSTSLNGISAVDSNQSINLNELTRILEEPEFEIWKNIYGYVSKTIIKRIFNYRLPLTYVGSSKSNVICNFNHYMLQSYRHCCETKM